jgi:hypothetical protein
MKNEDLKRKNRRYRIHYQLKKAGNIVMARSMSVTKRDRELSNIENKYLVELVGYGYAVCDKLF